MNRNSSLSTDLTKNQSLVMGTLSNANEPMSAYKILDKLRKNGLNAPLQVYRALDKLIEFGLVHRLESLNAFVACQHPDCEGKNTEAVMFAICEKCNKVNEFFDGDLVKSMQEIERKMDFSLDHSVIELRGLCAACK